MPYANNEIADQPMHSRSLISAFIVRFLDSMYNTYTHQVQNFKILAISAPEQTGLSLT